MGEMIIKNYNRTSMNEAIYKDIHDESVNTWWKIVKGMSLIHRLLNFLEYGALCLWCIPFINSW